MKPAVVVVALLRCLPFMTRRAQTREVLNGVGADGVGVKFPIFPVNCSYLPHCSRRKRKKSEEKRKQRGDSRQKSEEKRKKAQKRGDSLQPHLHQRSGKTSQQTQFVLIFLSPSEVTPSCACTQQSELAVVGKFCTGSVQTGSE